MLAETLAWIFMAAGVGGAWFNARQSMWCWYLWVPANIGWVGYFVWNQQWASAVLFLVYLGLGVHGYKVWSAKEEPKQNEREQQILTVWNEFLCAHDRGERQEALDKLGALLTPKSEEDE